MDAGDFGVGLGPDFPKKVETASLALGAGSMSGRQSGGFVEEEQLGVTARRHDGAMPVLEGEKADDPTSAAKRTLDPSAIVMQTTPVAHQRPTGGSGYERAEGGYPILPWHLSSVGFRRAQARRP
jgi:hypothetical protein